MSIVRVKYGYNIDDLREVRGGGHHPKIVSLPPLKSPRVLSEGFLTHRSRRECGLVS